MADEYSSDTDNKDLALSIWSAVEYGTMSSALKALAAHDASVKAEALDGVRMALTRVLETHRHWTEDGWDVPAIEVQQFIDELRGGES